MNNKSLKAAQQRADGIRQAMVKGQTNRMSLSNGAWQDICMAREKLRSLCTGDSLFSAITEWGDAKGMLGDRASLLDAIKFYLAHHKGGGPPLQPTRFGDAGTKFHSFMVKAGLSSSHTKNTKCRLNLLERKLPANANLHELTAGQLDAVVVSLGFGPKTMNEYRLTLSSLFVFSAVAFQRQPECSAR